MGQVFANNLTATLSAAVTSTATTLPIAIATGAFPTLAAGQTMVAELTGAGVTENVIVAASSSSSSLTVTRGVDGTTAQAWPSGTTLYFGISAAALNQFALSALVLATIGTYIGMPGNGTVGANGAVTFSTAISSSIGAAWMYYPANAITGSNAAGLYWTVMSSSTVGTIYNLTLPLGTQAYIPVSPPAFVGTTGVAYTQTTVSTPIWQAAVPGNTLGLSGKLTLDFISTLVTNVSGILSFGGQPMFYLGGNSGGSNGYAISIWNKGSPTSQVCNSPYSPGGGGSGSAANNFSIDTTVTQQCAVSVAGAPTNSFFLEAGALIAYPSSP